jgi:hypothetical protein
LAATISQKLSKLQPPAQRGGFIASNCATISSNRLDTFFSCSAISRVIGFRLPHEAAGFVLDLCIFLD